MHQAHRIWKALAVILLLAGTSTASVQPDKLMVDSIFADLTKPGSPGCALGVYRNGKIIYSRGYGLANIEENVPITPQSVFDVASLSKQFAAMSILFWKSTENCASMMTSAGTSRNCRIILSKVR